MLPDFISSFLNFSVVSAIDVKGSVFEVSSSFSFSIKENIMDLLIFIFLQMISWHMNWQHVLTHYVLKK